MNNTIKTMAKLIDWQFEGANYDVNELNVLVEQLRAFISKSAEVFNEYRGYIPEDDLMDIVYVMTQASKLVNMIED